MTACASREDIIIEAWETYPKQTIRNRCFIMGPNGQQMLSVPISKPHGNHTKTKDIRISHHLPWQANHWRSIETAYNKSPFLLYYANYFYPFFEQPFDHLLDFNDRLLETLMMILRIDKEWRYSTRYEASQPNQADQRVSKKSPPPSTRFPEYQQVFSTNHGFLSDLSVIDLICNLGPDAGDYIRGLNTK